MIRADLAAAPRAYGHVAAVEHNAEGAPPGARSSSSTPKLTHAERAVLRALEYRMNGKGFAFPSQRVLAEDTEYSPRAVKGAIAGLQRKGKLVVKRVSDLTDGERSAVERASTRAVRNWRNNVYFRFDAREVVGGKGYPVSGAIAARGTSLLDGRDQDRKPHHHSSANLGEDPRQRRSVVVDDPIADRACRQIVASWPTKLRRGFDEQLAMIALRRRFGEGMSVRDSLEAIEGAELEAERLIRDAKTTPFALVFGRCDGWRRFAEAARGARSAQTWRQVAERERRAAELELERNRLSPRENAEAAKALLAILEQPGGGIKPSRGVRHTPAHGPASPQDRDDPHSDRGGSGERHVHDEHVARQLMAGERPHFSKAGIEQVPPIAQAGPPRASPDAAGLFSRG